MKQAIILDFDGTIVDFSLRSYQCYLHCLDALDIREHLPFSDYWAMKRARAPMHVILGNHAPRIEAYHTLWMNTIEQPAFLLLDRLIPGAFDWLQKAQETHFLFLLSKRQFADRLLQELERLRIAPFFSRVLVVSHATGKKSVEIRRQPDFHDLSFAFWVGDTEEDIQSAHEIGIPAIAVASGVRNEDWLRQQAAIVHETLAHIKLENFSGSET